MNPHKEFVKLFDKLAYGVNRGQLFTDWCELTAIALRQPFYQDPEAEKRYLSIVGQYSKEHANKFAELLSFLVLGLEKEGDFLSAVFHELELDNKKAGQFFTPFHASRMMAKVLMGDPSNKEHFQRYGYTTLYEPCSGAGGMVLAFADEFKSAGYNPATQLLVTAADFDFNAANMTYIQLALAGIPAIVYRMNSLSLETYSSYLTPVYFIENWPQRIRMVETCKKVRDIFGNNKAQLPPPVDFTEQDGQLCFNF